MAEYDVRIASQISGLTGRGEAKGQEDPTEQPGKELVWKPNQMNVSRGLRLRTDFEEGSMKIVGQAGHRNSSGQGGQGRGLGGTPSGRKEAGRGPH